MAYKILIPDSLKPPADIEQSVLGRRVKFIIPEVFKPQHIDSSVWSTVDAVMLWEVLSLDKKTIEKLNRCKVIVRYGVGFDNVDIQAAGKKGIPVCNVPDYGTNDVADHAMALFLTLSRGILACHDFVKQGNWARDPVNKLDRIWGSTLGIIGLGRIGTAVALRAKAFGIHVKFYDPYIPIGIEKSLGLTRVSLEELLATSDSVSLHVPLTPETKNMVNKDFFKKLKKNALLINTARGKVIDLDALEEALKNKTVKAAGLDVLAVEPPDWNHPLLKAWKAGEKWIHNRLVVTPHVASFCKESKEELRRKTAITTKLALEGKSLINCVNTSFLKNKSQGKKHE